MKGIIFDADGTLLNSMGLWRQVDRDFLARHDYPYSETISETVETMSLTQSAEFFADLLAEQERLTPEQIVEELNGMCAGYYEREVQEMPYVPEMLQAAKRAGFSLCVATASVKSQIAAALDRLGLLSYFDFIMDADDVGSAKTDPTIFFAFAERLNLSPDQIWVVEDAPHAAKTAASAGFRVIGVHHSGTENQQKQMAEVCERYVPSFDCLLDKDKNWNLY